VKGHPGATDRPCDADTPVTGDTGPVGRPAGLLAELMAAVRPQFRAEDLVFDPCDPVFGGPACMVADCASPGRQRGMCLGHLQRWRGSGKPDLAVFVATATATAPWYGHRAVGSCMVVGCRYGLGGHGMCSEHVRQWERAGRPGLPRACPDGLRRRRRDRRRHRRPAGSTTAICGPTRRLRFAIPTTTGGDGSAALGSRRSSIPTPPDEVENTSTCAACQPSCDWRSPTCCSVAVTSRQ
jgi:hypothetical protein